MTGETYDHLVQSWAKFASHALGCADCVGVESVIRKGEASTEAARKALPSELCREGRPAYEEWLAYVSATLEEYRDRMRGRRTA